MNSTSLEAARQARQVLNKAGVDAVPVPVEGIARKFGIVVNHMPLDDDLSGMSFIKDGVAVIVVNSGHHPNRQRFTMAHELAHHILHKDYLEDNVHVDKVIYRNQKSSDGIYEKEIEANAFAAELLMPASHVKQYINADVNNEAEISRIAKIFKVSLSAMTIRLINLL
ncbi:MAG: ImmA/IrrE family metallo-endopeptidase [Sphingobacteriales bacterium]|nr:MAG: ImmA/IrrE family metallo-endopeptidase [Sphingobacteriales bacterium]